ncbi:hypothetical protein ACWIVU_06130 [Ursidibacter arcticus]
MLLFHTSDKPTFIENLVKVGLFLSITPPIIEIIGTDAKKSVYYDGKL